MIRRAVRVRPAFVTHASCSCTLGGLKKKYPLEPVATLRARKVAQGRREVLTRERRLERARVAITGAAEELSAARQGARASTEEERAQLERGLLTAEDLSRGGDLSRAQRAREAALEAALDTAKKDLQAAHRDQIEGAQALARDLLEEKLVERHRQSWATEQARSSQEREQDAALEQWSATQRGPGRR